MITILKCDNYVDDHMQGANPCTPRTTEMATSDSPNSEHFPTPIITKQCVFSNTHNYQTVSFSNTIFQSLPINYTILRQLIILKQDCKHAFQIKIKNQDGEYAYTYETDDVQWTPLNSNLQMQGIKVILSKKASYLSHTHN